MKRHKNSYPSKFHEKYVIDLSETDNAPKGSDQDIEKNKIDDTQPASNNNTHVNAT